MNGYWYGSYNGTNKGQMVVELDDSGDHFSGCAYLYDDDLTGSHSRAYILGRLARDAAAGCRDAGILLAGVTSQTISAHTAACEMSYCRRPEPTGRGSPNMTKARDWALYRLFNPRPDKGKAPPAGANGA
jgi:hypothetical protein